MYCGACNIHVTYAINPIYENQSTKDWWGM